MSDMKLSLIVEAIDRLTAPFQRMSHAVQGPISAAKRAFEGVDGILEKMSGHYESLAAAVGGGFELKEIIGDEDLFNRLRIQYKMTKESAEDLEHSLMDAAANAGAPLEEVMSALKGYAASGGDVADFADKLDLVSKSVALLGGHGDDVAEMLTGLEQKFNITGPKELAKSMAVLYEQSLKVPGGFEAMTNGLKKTAELYAALGHTGPQAAREIGAVYAMMAQGTDPREARSDLETFLQNLADPAQRTKFVGMGVKLGDADYGTNKVSVPITDILRQIGQEYASGKAGPTVVASQMSPEIFKALRTLFADVDRTGKAVTLDAKLSVVGDPKKMFEDADEASRSLSAQLSKLHSQLISVGEAALAGPLGMLADVMARFSKQTAYAVTVIGGLAVIGLAKGWILGGLTALEEFGGALVGAVGVVGDFILALRAGYGVVEAFDLVLTANPIGAVIAAVTVLAGAAWLIYEKWEPIKEFFSDLWDGIIEKIKWVVQHLPSLPSWITGSDKGGPAAVDAMGNVVPLGPAAPSAFIRSTGETGSERKKADVGGQITVRFDNAPPGLRVTETKSNHPDVNYMLEMGYALGFSG